MGNVQAKPFREAWNKFQNENTKDGGGELELKGVCFDSHAIAWMEGFAAAADNNARNFHTNNGNKDPPAKCLKRISLQNCSFLDDASVDLFVQFLANVATAAPAREECCCCLLIRDVAPQELLLTSFGAGQVNEKDYPIGNSSLYVSHILSHPRCPFRNLYLEGLCMDEHVFHDFCRALSLNVHREERSWQTISILGCGLDNTKFSLLVGSLLQIPSCTLQKLELGIKPRVIPLLSSWDFSNTAAAYSLPHLTRLLKHCKTLKCLSAEQMIFFPTSLLEEDYTISLPYKDFLEALGHHPTLEILALVHCGLPTIELSLPFFQALAQQNNTIKVLDVRTIYISCLILSDYILAMPSLQILHMTHLLSKCSCCSPWLSDDWDCPCLRQAFHKNTKLIHISVGTYIPDGMEKEWHLLNDTSWFPGCNASIGRCLDRNRRFQRVSWFLDHSIHLNSLNWPWCFQKLSKNVINVAAPVFPPQEIRSDQSAAYAFLRATSTYAVLFYQKKKK